MFRAAVSFYRDNHGMPEEFPVDSGIEARVVALQARRPTLELVTASNAGVIDRLEVGRDVSPPIRLAFEVADVDTATTRMIDAGAGPVAPPNETPWRSLNSRLDGPGPIQFPGSRNLAPGRRHKCKRHRPHRPLDRHGCDEVQRCMLTSLASTRHGSLPEPR